VSEPKVAIVIPFQLWDEWLRQCLERCAQQTYRNFECWLIADVAAPSEWQAFLSGVSVPGGVRVSVSGRVNPAKKRNIAMCESDAEIFAFVDADAYPVEGWLRLAVDLMKDDVCAVGGPNLTPPEDPLLRRVPGCIMKSMLGYGPAYIRHCPVSRRTVSELPTCNLVVRRMDGLFFREELDTSEDMTLCEDMIKRGGRIVYDPQVIVFHHRRCLFKPFFRQFYNYGVDKARITLQGSDAAYLWHSIPALHG
jgi:glycosyltransferase involved in cell wall biosynthesis